MATVEAGRRRGIERWAGLGGILYVVLFIAGSIVAFNGAPVGDERPARLFCGAPSVGTTSWCEHHQRMAFSGTWRPAASARLKAR